MARLLGTAFVLFGLGVTAAAATHPELACGRFRLLAPVVVGDGALVIQTISVHGAEVVLDDACVSARARIRQRRWGTRVVAVFPSCEGARRIKVRARIDDDCTAMQGRLQVRRPRTRVRFEAVPVTGHGCGQDGSCGPDEFCELPPGICAGDDPLGVCLPRPDACLDIYLPVCGCDGVTYGNDCERQAAGVSKSHEGPCECLPLPCPPDSEPVDSDGDGCADICLPVGCRENDECGVDQYCAKEAGQCGGRGACLPRPTICPLALMPVCGCDGRTYGNACEAAAVGVNVARRGACEAICGTIAGIPCPDGMVCDLEPGMCQVSDVGGICKPKPDGCPEIYAPVCGCDGVTYGNDCERLAAGAQKDHDGRCECEDLRCPPDTAPVDTDGDGCPDACINVRCETTADCPDDRYCDKPLGECAAPGYCMPRPLGCPDVWEPVCGCDGQTHSNWCDAAAAGTSIRHDGACEAMCGTLLGIPCPGGMHCELPAGTCPAADLGGMCIPIPDACPRIFAPVCGCDGVTYANDCERVVARAQKNHDGPCGCPDLQCPPDTKAVDLDGDGCPDECVSGRCEQNDHCPRGTYCERDHGVCEGVGFCMERPSACILIYDPVCGCDGHTYGNACEAAGAGVNVLHHGPCDCTRLVCPVGAAPVDTDGDGCPDLCSVPPCDVVCALDGCTTVCPEPAPD